MGTAMGTGMGTRILTRQIPVPVAVPVTKKLDSIIHSTNTPTTVQFQIVCHPLVTVTDLTKLWIRHLTL
jgi:hypothetical protein